MDDNDVEYTFEGLPFRCVALLEDIDCAGVYRVDNYDNGDYWEGDDNFDYDENTPDDGQNSVNHVEIPTKKPSTQGKPEEYNPPKRVTLSGLLNAIDGASSQEGRLLIMTTNAPRSLDPALYRPGRIDMIIEMGYSTKVTAELCFSRMFGQDPCRGFTGEAIARFAQAFRLRFPRKSKTTPAELSKYCLNHRGDPIKAVQELGKFLHLRKTGEDGFKYDINDDVPGLGEEEDLEDEFIPDLLQVYPGDTLEIERNHHIDRTSQPINTKKASKPWWSFLSPDSTLQVRTSRNTQEVQALSLFSRTAQTCRPKPEIPISQSETSDRDIRAAVMRAYWEAYPFISRESLCDSGRGPNNEANGRHTRERTIREFWASYPFINQKDSRALKEQAENFSFDNESLLPDAERPD